MTKIELVKATGEIIVSLGVSAIVSNAIKATTPENINSIRKICIIAGGVVLSAIASDIAVSYTEKKMNDAIRQFNMMVTK